MTRSGAATCVPAARRCAASAPLRRAGAARDSARPKPLRRVALRRRRAAWRLAATATRRVRRRRRATAQMTWRGSTWRALWPRSCPMRCTATQAGRCRWAPIPRRCVPCATQRPVAAADAAHARHAAPPLPHAQAGAAPWAFSPLRQPESPAAQAVERSQLASAATLNSVIQKLMLAEQVRAAAPVRRVQPARG